LRADSSPQTLAAESHRETEVAIRASGLTFTILRNGWYTENDTQSIPAAIKGGAFYGSAKDGKISSAA
jgi:NAD(P)H dehydrogenase (quinone)